MNKSTTGRFLPYEDSYDRVHKARTSATAVLYTLTILSLSLPWLESELPSSGAIDLFSLLTLLLTGAYFAISTVTDVTLYRNVAMQRRLAFIDNSFQSRLLGQSVRGYYTNDSVAPGTLRMTVNCFENCYFTYNIARAMTPWIVTRNAALGTLFLAVAYFGFRENYLALPLMQAMVSSLFLAELIHHLRFRAELSSLLVRFRDFFLIVHEGRAEPADFPRELALVLDYEISLAHNKSPLSDRQYRKRNKQLSADWIKVKEFYGI